MICGHLNLKLFWSAVIYGFQADRTSRDTYIDLVICYTRQTKFFGPEVSILSTLCNTLLLIIAAYWLIKKLVITDYMFVKPRVIDSMCVRDQQSASAIVAIVSMSVAVYLTSGPAPLRDCERFTSLGWSRVPRCVFKYLLIPAQQLIRVVNDPAALSQF